MGRELPFLIWQLPFYHVEALLTYLEEKRAAILTHYMKYHRPYDYNNFIPYRFYKVSFLLT